MTEYALVENGVVTEVRATLPKSWKNVSNLSALAAKPQILNTLGWYVVQMDIPPYDMVSHELRDIQYTYTNETVSKTGTIQAVVRDIEQQKANFLEVLRRDRDAKIALTDWTQLYDVQLQKSSEWVAAWATYRAELRNLPSKYSDLSSYDDIEIEWPEVPNVIS